MDVGLPAKDQGEDRPPRIKSVIARMSLKNEKFANPPWDWQVLSGGLLPDVTFRRLAERCLAAISRAKWRLVWTLGSSTAASGSWMGGV